MSDPSLKSVTDLEQEIRDFINSPRKQHTLLKDSAAWNMLCSCLDVIGDTELAFQAYDIAKDPNDVGDKYLLVYGVLQALFIQQDAVRNLCEALEINYTPNQLLRHIREIRSDSIGHPTKRGRGKGHAYNFISRHSLNKNGFELMTTFPDGRKPLFKTIYIPSLIETQTDVLKEVLTEVVKKLRDEEEEHREAFRSKRLQDAFTHTLRYHIGKVYEATYGSNSARISIANMKAIRQTVERFTEMLQERDSLDTYESVTDLLNRLRYPISELTLYLESPNKSTLNDETAYIFCFFIEKHLDELKEIAKEIDEEYQSKP